MAWRANFDLGKLWASRDYNRARDYFIASLDLARKINEPHLRATSLYWIGNWHANHENPQMARKNHEEALKIFEDLGKQSNLANTLDLLALANMLGADLPTSVTHFNRAILLFRELNDRPRLSSCLLGRANTLVSLVWLALVAPTPPPDAICDCNEGLRIAREIHLASEETWGLYSLGLLHIIHGHFGNALEFIGKGLSIATGIGHREYEVGNRFSLGILYTELFSLDLAQGQLERALALAGELRSQTWLHIVNGALAAVSMIENDQEATRSYLETATSPQAPMDTLGRRYCWVRQAELALMQGDPEYALEITERLIASAPSMSPGRVISYLWMLKGDALTVLSRYEEALTFYEVALDHAQVTGEHFLLWRIHAALSHINQTMGNLDAANREISRARAEIDELSATIPDQVLRDTFRQGAAGTINLRTLQG